MKIKLLSSALEDLYDGRLFYEKQGEGLGEYFYNSLFSDIDSLTLHAGIHPKFFGYYRMLSKRFPYAIYYKIEEVSLVVVWRVLDLRRQKPDAKFLFVELTVRNDDKQARSIAPFKLIDENNAEYEASSKAWAVEGSIGVLTSLNPSVKKQGFIVFDVPTEHKYKLKLSGGYWSNENALVQLSPKASK